MLVDELCYNAVGHGNRFDPNKPFELRLYKGKNGMLMSIHDSGEGFDVDEVLEKGLKENGNLGMIIIKELDNSIEWSYVDGGSTVNVLMLYGS